MAVSTTQTTQFRSEITQILNAKENLRVQIDKLVRRYTELGGAGFFTPSFPQDEGEVLASDFTTAISNLTTLRDALESTAEVTVPSHNYDAASKLRV